VDGAIRAHGQAGAQRLLRPVGAERHRDHFALPALFLDAQPFLQRELVVGRHDPGDAGGVDGLRIRADLDLGGGVGHLLDHHENLHAVTLLS
jgi:hypothetical protein